MIRGRYANVNIDQDMQHYNYTRSKYFCSTSCQDEWLNINMTNVEQSRPIEFIRHRRESQGYAKVKNEDRWGGQYSIQRVDNGQVIE